MKKTWDGRCLYVVTEIGVNHAYILLPRNLPPTLTPPRTATAACHVIDAPHTRRAAISARACEIFCSQQTLRAERVPRPLHTAPPRLKQACLGHLVFGGSDSQIHTYGRLNR